MSDMPDYTAEEKAAAFDLMWKHLGPGIPRFSHYFARDVKGRCIAEFDAIGRMTSAVSQYERVPVYEFKINFSGNCNSFKDVLHSIVMESREIEKKVRK